MQRADVFRAFAPRPDMRLYGRGIRRRLAPMLRGDRRRIELAYALQFSLPGTPVIRYGEEIGMGENLALHGREAIRTPMQWDDGPNAGFSTAKPERADAAGQHPRQVRRQERQRTRPAPRSRLAAALVREPGAHPADGTGDRHRHAARSSTCRCPRRCWPTGSTRRPARSCCCTTWPTSPVTIDIGRLNGHGDRDPYDLLVDGPYDAPSRDLTGLSLHGWGYRWIRLARSDHG